MAEAPRQTAAGTRARAEGRHRRCYRGAEVFDEAPDTPGSPNCRRPRPPPEEILALSLPSSAPPVLGLKGLHPAED